MRAAARPWVLAVAACASTACSSGSDAFRLPAISGRVVDDTSGEGIAGAEVIEWFRGRSGGADTLRNVVHARWTTTAADGSFSFPAASSKAKGWSRASYGPSYSFYHPSYGLVRGGGPVDGRVRLQGSLARAELALADLAPYCSGELQDAGARRLAEVACAGRERRPRR